MTLDELLFRKDDQKRSRLIDVLNDATLQEALAILMSVPTKEPAFVPGVPLDTTIAHEFCRMMGANQVSKGLVRMTHPPRQSPEEKEDRPEEEYQHTLPPELQPDYRFPSAPQIPIVETPSKKQRKKK